MEVVKKGREQRGWSKKFKCTGKGNGGGGCGTILLVSEYDFYETSRICYDGSGDTYNTFCCSECGVETDVPSRSKPPELRGRRPSEKERRRIALKLGPIED